MSSGAISSQYQAKNAPDSTFQPNISSSDSDYSDEKKAVATYQATYGTQGKVQNSSSSNSAPTTVPAYPTLSMAYQSIPDLIPLPDTGGGSSGGAAPPDAGFPIYIELGTLLSTEQTFYNATQALVQDYENTLVPVVRNAIASGTLFGQAVTESTGVSPGSKASEIYPTEKTDPLDQEGTKFAAAINPQMGKLLQSIGNMIEAFGSFTAMINKAGQYYTDTDAHSAFPPPGLMEGPTVLGPGPGS